MRMERRGATKVRTRALTFAYKLRPADATRAIAWLRTACKLPTSTATVRTHCADAPQDPWSVVRLSVASVAVRR